MTLTLENVNNQFYEIIKNLVKLDDSIVLKKDDYSFDDLNDETKQAILDTKNLSKSFNSIDDLMRDLKS